MCTLFHCQGRWFLLGGSDASLGLRQMAHLAPFLIASWPAPVLSGITSHTGSPGHTVVFHPVPRCGRCPGRMAIVAAWWPRCRVGGAPAAGARLVCSDSMASGEMGTHCKPNTAGCGDVSETFDALILGLQLQMCYSEGRADCCLLLKRGVMMVFFHSSSDAALSCSVSEVKEPLPCRAGGVCWSCAQARWSCLGLVACVGAAILYLQPSQNGICCPQATCSSRTGNCVICK